MSLAHYQLATALIWTLAGAFLLPGTFRSFFGRAKDGDHWKSALFFVSGLFVAFPSRWIVAPQDVATWKLLYALGILLAVYVIVLIWNGRAK